MKKLSFSVISVLFLFICLSLPIACSDQEVDESISDGDSDTDADSESGTYTLNLTYKDKDYNVSVDALPTVEFEGEQMISLVEVFDAAGIETAMADLYFDFMSKDGYRPSGKGDCVGLFPIKGTNLADGYLLAEAHRIYWNKDLGWDGCASVSDLATIIITDDPDAKPDGFEVKVYYYGGKNKVDVSKLASQDFGGKKVVSLDKIVEAASLGKALDTLLFDVVAKDGYRPAKSGNCTGVVPFDDRVLKKGYVELESHNIAWEDSLNLPGCMGVDDMSEIIVTDVSPQPYTVTAKYDGNDYPVDIMAMTGEIVDGIPVLSLTDFLVATGIDTDVNTLTFDFEAEDGYRSGEQDDCKDLLPLAGKDIVNGYLSQEGHRLYWLKDFNAPTCLKLKFISKIIIADK